MLPSQNDGTRITPFNARDQLMRSNAVNGSTHLALLSLANSDEKPSWNADAELKAVRDRGGQ